jgi:antitoxin component of MazEF toxin-antitoxin module
MPKPLEFPAKIWKQNSSLVVTIPNIIKKSGKFEAGMYVQVSIQGLEKR